MKMIRNLLSFFLILFMVNSFSVYALAESSENYKYQDVFQQYFEENVENLDELEQKYQVCYGYFSTSNSSETPDWALVYAFCGWGIEPGIPTGIYLYTVCSDYFLDASGTLSEPYEFAYYVYVPSENKIYTLNEAFDAKLENIDYTFTQYLLVNKPYCTNIIVDADKDRKLTVLDATAIQRKLAGLATLMDNIASEHNASYSERLYSLSDVDRDGELSILDATAIQMKLAQI